MESYTILMKVFDWVMKQLTVLVSLILFLVDFVVLVLYSGVLMIMLASFYMVVLLWKTIKNLMERTTNQEIDSAFLDFDGKNDYIALKDSWNHSKDRN